MFSVGMALAVRLVRALVESPANKEAMEHRAAEGNGAVVVVYAVAAVGAVV